MQNETAGARSSVRYEPDKPPKLLAFGLGLQLSILCVGGVVLTPAIVVRAAGGSDTYLTWAVFAAVAVCGITTVVQAVRVGRIGRLRAADGHVGSVHRGVRRRARHGRAGDAGNPGGHLGAVSVRTRRGALPVAAHPDSDRGGDGDHADRGHGHAHRVRHAEGCAGERGAGGRADQRSGNRAGDHRAGAEGHRSAPPLGTRHRRGRRLGGRRTVRSLRRGIGGRRRVDRRAVSRLAGLRSEFRAGLLGAPAGVRVRDPGRCHRDDRRWRGHPARVLAAAAGGGLWRG